MENYIADKTLYYMYIQFESLKQGTELLTLTQCSMIADSIIVVHH